MSSMSRSCVTNSAYAAQASSGYNWDFSCQYADCLRPCPLDSDLAAPLVLDSFTVSVWPAQFGGAYAWVLHREQKLLF